ncbi:MAG TPA: YigZ family protein [Bacteroidales bacterium]|nr:YigZ family protein [Bacteroidales bacterium]
MPEIISDTYLTIENPSKGLFKDKGSKFFAFAFPVSAEQEIKKHLESIKKEYFDARHHCFAYRLGPDMKTFRAFDDGEPSGTAGKPILGQIASNNLTNILIVVVRYFGGTLLGVSGLIQAYKSASADVIANSVIVEKEVLDEIRLTFDYPLQNQVSRILKECNVKISKSDFGFDCALNIHCRKSFTPELIRKMKELLHVKIVINDNLLNQNI